MAVQTDPRVKPALLHEWNQPGFISCDKSISRHSRGGGNPAKWLQDWIPASAGMTIVMDLCNKAGQARG